VAGLRRRGVSPGGAEAGSSRTVPQAGCDRPAKPLSSGSGPGHLGDRVGVQLNRHPPLRFHVSVHRKLGVRIIPHLGTSVCRKYLQFAGFSHNWLVAPIPRPAFVPLPVKARATAAGTTIACLKGRGMTWRFALTTNLPLGIMPTAYRRWQAVGVCSASGRWRWVSLVLNEGSKPVWWPFGKGLPTTRPRTAPGVGRGASRSEGRARYDCLAG
jgi:hypothetical protein